MTCSSTHVVPRDCRPSLPSHPKDPNEELAGYLKFCPHEWQEVVVEGWVKHVCVICNAAADRQPDYDFSTPAGIVLLLREMMKRGDWWVFARKIYINYPTIEESLHRFLQGHITDATGKLRAAALEFFREKYCKNTDCHHWNEFKGKDCGGC